MIEYPEGWRFRPWRDIALVRMGLTSLYGEEEETLLRFAEAVVRDAVPYRVACLMMIPWHSCPEGEFHRRCDWLDVAIDCCEIELEEIENDVRKVAAGAAMRRQTRSMMPEATQAARGTLSADRIEQLVAEEAAWWLRRRADA